MAIPRNLPVSLPGIAKSIQVDTTDLDKLNAAIAQIRQAALPGIYKEFYQYFRDKTATRYRQASRQTPYARASIGRKQKVSGLVMGRGALFGIDSGALFQQLVNNVRINGQGIYIYSDRSYAERIMQFYARKGPFAPNSVLFVDDEDLSYMGQFIAKGVQGALNRALA